MTRVIREIKPLLVRRLKISNKKADELILSKKIKINGEFISGNILITEWDEIFCEDIVVQPKKEAVYFLFHKPRGIESTMSKVIENGLMKFVPEGLELYHVGRLDKESEGLMLLTNDGSISKLVLEGEVEKEYVVEVEPYSPENKTDNSFKERMESGVVVLGKKTKPCKVNTISEHSFSIILTEGKNRQIRRMCHQLGFQVISLKRIRIGSLQLEDLKEGDLKRIPKENIF